MNADGKIRDVIARPHGLIVIARPPKAAVAISLFVLLVFAAPAQAAVESGPIQKLGRGVANLMFGWTEMPLQVARTTERSGSIAGITVGLGRGVVLGIGRTIVGTLEVLTFPIPNPTTGYGPVILPEFPTFRDAER